MKSGGSNFNGWLTRSRVIATLIALLVGGIVGVYSWALSIGDRAEAESRAYTDACIGRLEGKVDRMSGKLDTLIGDFRELRGEVNTVMKKQEEK